MKIIVTGASGFIGSHLVEYYSRNHEVVSWAGPSFKKPSQNDSLVRTVDLLEDADLSSLINQDAPDLVFHCAGRADVAWSFEHAEEDRAANVLATMNILGALAKSDYSSSRFIYLSSAAVYGPEAHVPTSEEAPLDPRSPYARDKVAAEEYCRDFSARFGLDMRIARIFSTYGPGLAKQIFWDMFERAEETGMLTMRGTRSTTRDYLFIDDCILALSIIAEAPREAGNVFNIGSGKETTIEDAALLFAEVMGLDKDRVEFPEDAATSATSRSLADITRLETLGFEPQTELRQGVEQYVSWALGQVGEKELG